MLENPTLLNNCKLSKGEKKEEKERKRKGG
jgi:hypothetical protein